MNSNRTAIAGQHPSETPDYTRLWANLASAGLGARICSFTDEFFAKADRMLQDNDPVFIADKYDEHGKWMDGWETRRRREPGWDSCIIQLATRGVLHGVDIDTSHFTGNYPEAASLDIRDSEGDEWREIVPRRKLTGNSHHFIDLPSAGPATQARLNIYPDGGVARLRLYGAPVYDWDSVSTNTEIELSGFAHGGRIISYNDAHYGSPWSILTPGRGVNMGDGWETRRRRTPGHDWLIFSLGTRGTIERVEVDTAHFKGNYPHSCSLQADALEPETEPQWPDLAADWPVLLDKTPLGPDAIHQFGSDQLKSLGPVNAVRLNIYPDGGISRIRLFGKKS
jgi:allantoicase